MGNKLICIFVALIMAGSAAYGAGVSKKKAVKKDDVSFSSKKEEEKIKSPVIPSIKEEKSKSQVSSSIKKKEEKIKIKSLSQALSSFAKARRYYLDGKIDKAESILDDILLANPGYRDAVDLKNTIMIIKEKMYIFKRTTAEDYLTLSESALNDGNFYEGFLFYKKAVDLVPEMEDERRYNVMKSDLEAKSLKFAPEDRQKFITSVEAFKNENFKKAQNIVSYLAEKYESMKFVRGLMQSYQISYPNEKRTKELYSQAVKYFEKGRFETAKSYLEDALAMDPRNPDFVFLSERISAELR
ncbi:MAG: hypothetical protein FWD54_04760 [Endomicrobia bacterium]|nr:hypothetical protein [Endomicrobiia bacterium]